MNLILNFNFEIIASAIKTLIRKQVNNLTQPVVYEDKKFR